MRITAVSDIHGNLANVLNAVEESSPDLLLSAGDWGDPEEYTSQALQSIIQKVHMLTVYGNHDNIELLSHTSNIDGSAILLKQGEIRQIGDLTFAGISGIWAKSHRKPHYITDEDVYEIALKLKGKHIDVFLTHGCPIGLGDVLPAGKHGGQKCFLEAFHSINPRLYLCGHLHNPQQRALKNGSVIVNLGYTNTGDYWTFTVDNRIIETRFHTL